MFQKNQRKIQSNTQDYGIGKTALMYASGIG